MSILRDFNLPIADKSIGSPRKADPMIDASSISSYVRQGTTTVQSHPSYGTRTASTALSWHDPARSTASESNQSMGTSNQGFGADFGALSPRQSSNVILRPGPSLIESMVHVNRQSEYPPEQYHRADTDQPGNFNPRLSSSAVEVPLRRSLFDGRAIDFGNEVVSPVRRLDMSARAPTPSWMTRIPSVDDDAPPSGQKRMFRPSQESSQVHRADQTDTMSNNDWKFDRTLDEEAQVISKSQQDTMSSVISKKATTSDRARSSVPKKPTAAKRGSTKIFKSTAAQTEYKSVSRATQTDPVYMAPITDDVAADVDRLRTGKELDNIMLMSPGASLYPKDEIAVNGDMVMIGVHGLPRRKERRINKFSRRRNDDILPGHKVSPETTSSRKEGSSTTSLAMQPPRRRRGGNKFMRRLQSLQA